MISTRELIRLVEEAARRVRSARVVAEQLQVRPQPDQIELLVASLENACASLEFAKFGKEFSTSEERIYPSRSAALEAVGRLGQAGSIGFQLTPLDDGSCALRLWLSDVAR